MPRSKNKVASRARRKKVLKLAKGNFGRRKNVYTVAKNTVEKGLAHAYDGRRLKKRDFRALWIQRINAATRTHGMSYSVFMTASRRTTSTWTARRSPRSPTAMPMPSRPSSRN